MMNGKPLLVSNVLDLSAQDIVARQKSLDDIERGFHVLKSQIEIAPVFLRPPERIRAHASICFMALVMHRVMRQRLKLADSTLLPDAASRRLRRVLQHQVRIDCAQPTARISTIHQDQADTLEALQVKKASLDAQMSLLQWHAARAPLGKSRSERSWCRTPVSTEVLPQTVTIIGQPSSADKNCQSLPGPLDTNRHLLWVKREKARRKQGISGWHAPCKGKPVPNPNLFSP